MYQKFLVLTDSARATAHGVHRSVEGFRYLEVSYSSWKTCFMPDKFSFRYLKYSLHPGLSKRRSSTSSRRFCGAENTVRTATRLHTNEFSQKCRVNETVHVNILSVFIRWITWVEQGHEKIIYNSGDPNTSYRETLKRPLNRKTTATC